MKKSVITLGGRRVLVVLLFLIGMMLTESCSSSCKKNRRYWSCHRVCEVSTDTIPQYAFDNNSIVMYK